MKRKIWGLFLMLVPLASSAQTAPIYSIATDLYQKLGNQAAPPTLVVDDAVLKDLTGIFTGDATSVAAQLSANPFLTGRITFNAVAGVSPGGVHAMAFLQFDANTSGPGGLNITSVANAVASLMIDRAKEELTLDFFSKLQTFSQKHPEFQTLFPKTFSSLRNLLSYSYPQVLPALRTAFLADLGQLTYNLEAVLELPKYKTLVANFPEINMGIQVLKLYHQLEMGVTPDKIIAAIDQAATSIEGNALFLSNAGVAFKNLLTTVHFAQLLSASLRDAGGAGLWITASQATDLVSKDLLTDLYLGLLWQQIKNQNLMYYLDSAQPNVGTSLESLIGGQAGNVLQFQNKISQFLGLSAKVEAAYAQISTKQAGEKVTPDEYSNFISASLDAINYTLTTIKMFDTRAQVDDYLAIATKSGELFKDIYAQQYTQAVGDALDVVSSIQLLVSASGGANSTDVAGALTYQQSSDTLSNFVSKVKPFALFIANVAEAKSEDDIKAALDNAILPVGSSSIKKNTSGNLCIQTYLGAYYSFYNYTPTAIRSWSDKVGVYGPIGLAYTPGSTSWGRGGSLSLFASAFDLGAIIDYQLKNDPSVSTSTSAADASGKTKQYSINLNQLFSPGIHLVYGFFCNLPLSLGVGAQYGPGLSSITTAGTTNVINPSWRFNIFLAVDLPFFNLVNEPRTK